MPKLIQPLSSRFTFLHSAFVIPSGFGIRISSFSIHIPFVVEEGALSVP